MTKSVAVSDPNEKSISNKCNFFAKVKVTESHAAKSQIVFSLKYMTPPWISALNTDSEFDRTKTAGLEYLIAGIEDAYKFKTEPKFFFRNVVVNLIQE